MPATERAPGRLARRLPWSPGKRGLVCVSGGSDSMALLRLLLERRERDGLELSVLHFDHGLRPRLAVCGGVPRWGLLPQGSLDGVR